MCFCEERERENSREMNAVNLNSSPCGCLCDMSVPDFWRVHAESYAVLTSRPVLNAAGLFCLPSLVSQDFFLSVQ